MVMKRRLRNVTAALYVLLIVSMAIATIVEKYHGTVYVLRHIYGAWWFSLLWAFLATSAILLLIKNKVRRASTVLLHVSFMIILLGAFITHVSSYGGMVKLRQNCECDKYMSLDSKGNVVEHALPFTVTLKEFRIKFHEGTDAEQDYVSRFTIDDNGVTTEAEVSMNNIFSYRGFRFYQSSYDEDRRGSVLSMQCDPYGIPVTYTGYCLLFVSLLWMLLDPKGTFRRLFRELKADFSVSGMRPMALVGILLALGLQSVGAARTLPRETAEGFGRLYMLHNQRICQLQTFANDFTKKLCGKSGYNGLTPEQVVTGFVFYGDEWSGEPIIRLKRGALRQTLQLPEYVSVNTFFQNDMGGYRLGPYIREYYGGNHDEFHKQAIDVDDRLQMILALRRGLTLKLFPYTTPHGTTTWHSPTETLPAGMDSLNAQFVRNVFSYLYQEAIIGNYSTMDSVVAKTRKYQSKNAGISLPSPLQTRAERAYNAFPFATVLFMLNLGMAVVSLAGFVLALRRPLDEGRTLHRRRRAAAFAWLCRAVLLLSWLALTLCLALRWIVSGTVPMSNGYETMLFVAWLVMILSLLLSRWLDFTLTLGFLMSGFFLLVAHIGQMNPQITHVMPVLNSPLLSIHVSVIMFSFALLSLTFIISLSALLCSISPKNHSFCGSLTLLSRFLLYPAMAFLGLGIFIGAIWANVSWGTYWNWDAKEVWGLITFMIYAVALHRESLPFLRRPFSYNLFMVLAFLSIIMTYFGVNYFLGGMHSYA